MTNERERHTQRTWSITERTAARVNALADENEVWPSALVEMILARGLDAIEAGEWPLRKVPVKFVVRW